MRWIFAFALGACTLPTESSDSAGQQPAATGCVPTVEISPTNLSFVATPAGQSSVLKLSIASVGCGKLGIRDIRSLDESAPFSLPWAAEMEISTGAYTLLEVQFSPEEIGTFSSELEITTDDPDRATVSVPISGTATGPLVRFQPTSIDFGEVIVECSATTTFTLLNESAYIATVTGIELDLPAQFSWRGRDRFSELPVDVGSLSANPFELDFHPDALGVYASEFRVLTASEPRIAISIAGVGVYAGEVANTYSADGGRTDFDLWDLPVEGTIMVYVDGVLQVGGWTYNAIDNSVSFDAATVPDAGATVEIRYVPAGECG